MKRTSLLNCVAAITLLTTGIQAQTTLTNGLVAYYPFDGNQNDASGSGHVATAPNGITWTPGAVGQAALFDGSSQYFSVADPAGDLNFDARSQNYSVALWVRLDNVADRVDQTFMHDRGGQGHYSYYFLYSNSGGASRFLFQTWDGNLGSPSEGVVGVTNRTAPATGQWYHVAAVMDQGRLRLYVNGVDEAEPIYNSGIIGAGYGSTENTEGVAMIGRFGGGPSNTPHGALDELRVYNRALSPVEVRQLAGSFMADETLVAWYPFDGSAADASGNGHNGGAPNGVTWSSGAIGGAVELDGVNQYLTLDDPNSDLSFDVTSQPYSISMWIKFKAVTSSPYAPAIFLDRFDRNDRISYQLQCDWLRTNAFWFSTWDGATAVSVHSTTLPAPGRWYHIGLVCDTKQLRLYVNGRMENADGTGAIPANLGSTRNSQIKRTLGRWMGQHVGDYFNGYMDDLRIYNRALAATELRDLYSMAALEQTSVEVAVKAVRVTLHIIPTRKYQLQASLDLRAWSNVGDPFVAATSEVTQDFDASEVGRFFRIQEVP